MSIALAQWLVTLVGVYAALGLLFVLPFVLRGAAAIDPGAREGTWGFHLLMVPGVVAFWPLLAHRWWRRRGLPEESNPHRCAAHAATGKTGSETKS